MWGGHDPDYRMPMVWADLKYDLQAIDPRGRERDPNDSNFNGDLFAFYKKAVGFRRQQHALNHGDFDIVKADDEQRCLVIRRHSQKVTVRATSNSCDLDSTVTCT